MIAVSLTNSNQKSINKSIELSGVGLHSGLDVEIRLEQAPEDNGIKFIRTDKKRNNIIDALWSNFFDCSMNSCLELVQAFNSMDFITT